MMWWWLFVLLLLFWLAVFFFHSSCWEVLQLYQNDDEDKDQQYNERIRNDDEYHHQSCCSAFWMNGCEDGNNNQSLLSLPLRRCCISEGTVDSFKVTKNYAWLRCPKMPPKRSPDQSEPDQLDDLADCKAPPAMDPQGGCRQGMVSTDLRKHCCREQRSRRPMDPFGATRANWPHQKPKRG